MGVLPKFISKMLCRMTSRLRGRVPESRLRSMSSVCSERSAPMCDGSVPCHTPRATLSAITITQGCGWARTEMRLSARMR